MSKGMITAITPVKYGADAQFLSSMLAGLATNSRVTAWAAACHPEDVPMVTGLGALHGFETLVVEEHGTNVAKLRNLLLSFVSTRYFVQADADDLYTAHALDQLAANADLYPGVGGAFGACTDFDSATNETVFHTPRWWMDFDGGLARPGQLAKRRHQLAKKLKHFPVAPYPPHPGAGIFATDTLLETDGYPEHDGGNFWEDVEHLGRVNRRRAVLMNPDLTVMHYRKHPGSLTATQPTRRRWSNVEKRLHAIETGALTAL